MKYLSKTIEYGLYLLVFCLPLQTRWIISQGVLNHGPWEYGTYSLYGTDILLIVLLILFVINKFSTFLPSLRLRRTGNLKTKQKPWFIWLFVFGLVLAAAVSVLFAADKTLALYKLSWLIFGVGLFWLLLKGQYSKIKLIWSLFFGVTFQALLAIWQFLSQATLENKWLGLAFHKAGELGTSVIETVGQDGIGERWLRAYGGVDHPNILGGLMAIGILLLIGEIIRADRHGDFSAPPRSGALNLRTLKILSWPLLVIFTAALFFSFSRSAWLGLAAGLAVLFIWLVVKKNWLAQKSLLQAVLIMGAVSFFLFLQYPNLVMTRLYATNRLDIKSTSERVESIKNSWPVIKKHWACAVGPGNYGLALRNELKPGEQSYYYQPVHNVFILVWAETGLSGLLFFIIIIVGAFVRSPRRRECATPRNDNVAGIFNIAVMICLIVIMCFDHWLWSLHFGVLFMWLIMGLAARHLVDFSGGPESQDL